MVLNSNGLSNNIKIRHILKRANHCVNLTASFLINVMQKQLLNGSQIVMSDVEDTDQTYLNETDPCASTEHQAQ